MGGCQGLLDQERQQPRLKIPERKAQRGGMSFGIRNTGASGSPMGEEGSLKIYGRPALLRWRVLIFPIPPRRGAFMPWPSNTMYEMRSGSIRWLTGKYIPCSLKRRAAEAPNVSRWSWKNAATAYSTTSTC